MLVEIAHHQIHDDGADMPTRVPKLRDSGPEILRKLTCNDIVMY